MTYYHPRYLFRRYEIMRRIDRGERFLEVGPGDLNLARELLRKFKRGTLIDFNTTSVQQIFDGLKEPDKSRLTLIIGDFLRYDGSGQGFDCVVSCEVMEHIEDDRAFLLKTCELLRGGGQLILSVPARQKYWSVDDEVVGHYRRYEKEDLRRQLSDCGYASIQIVSYGFPFENLIRLLRVGVAKLQYREKGAWDKKRQSQESGFLLKRNPVLNLVGLIINKYTIYPFALFASIFDGLNLGEGYLATARKSAA